MVLRENFALLAWEIGALGVSLSWHMPTRQEGGLNFEHWGWGPLGAIF